MSFQKTFQELKRQKNQNLAQDFGRGFKRLPFNT